MEQKVKLNGPLFAGGVNYARRNVPQYERRYATGSGMVQDVVPAQPKTVQPGTAVVSDNVIKSVGAVSVAESPVAVEAEQEDFFAEATTKHRRIFGWKAITLRFIVPFVSLKNLFINLASFRPRFKRKARPAAQSTVKITRRPTRNVSWRQYIVYGAALMLFIVGGLVSLNGLRANRQVEAQVTHLQKASEGPGSGGATETAVPSATKPSSDQVANYAVAPNIPKYLDIPRLGIHTRILSEGITKTGALDVPWNIYDTGWYNASAQPGQAGAMLVDGHSGIGKMHGIFWQLAVLTPGDQIIVTRGDGQKFTYVVSKIKTEDVSNVSMANMLVSADTSKPGLNLITCTGDQIPGTDQLNKRVEVYAVLQ